MHIQTRPAATADLPGDWALPDRSHEEWTPDWLTLSQPAAAETTTEKPSGKAPTVFLPADWNE